MESQEGAFNSRKSALSLDLKSNGSHSRDRDSGMFEQKTPLQTFLDINYMNSEITLAQKQYAQGFLDALRSVHTMNNFEYAKKPALLSPGCFSQIPELASPLQASTPTTNRDLQAILQAIATTPLGQVPSTVAGFPSPFASVLPGPATVASTVVPSTSTTSVPPPFAPHPPPTTSGMDASRDFKPLMDIKPEPTYQSEDSTDNMSERSRSSSAAPASSHGSAHMGKQDYEMSLDEQERRKLERKRARNRAAASKCRQKKMDRIQELESMVNTEKQRSMSLMEEYQRIRSQLHHLEQIAARHAAHGCPSHV